MTFSAAPAAPSRSSVRIMLLAALTAGTLSALPVAPAAAATGWSTTDLAAVTDNDGVEPVPGREAQSASLAASGERVAMAWVDTRRVDSFNGSENTELALRTSSDGGRTFGPLRNLSRTSTAERVAAAAVTAGATVVATQVDVPSDHTVKTVVVRVDDHGTEQRTELDTGSFTSTPIRLAADAAAGTLVLLAGRNLSTSSDDGRSWTSPAPVRVGDEGTFVHDAEPVISGQTITLLWRAVPGGSVHNDVYAATSTDAGASFAAPVKVTTTPQRELPVALARHEQTIVAAWQTARSSTSTTLEIASSTDDGRTWSAPRTVQDAGLDAASISNTAVGLVVDQHGVAVSAVSRLHRGADLDSLTEVVARQPAPHLLARTGGGELLGTLGGSRLHRLYDDTAAPVVTVTGWPAPFSSAQEVRLAVQATDDVTDSDSLSYHCQSSGSIVREDEPHGRDVCGPVVRARMFRPGPQSLSVTVTDEVGNATTVTHTWIWDPIAPVTGAAPTFSTGRLTLAPSTTLTLEGRDRVGVVAYQVQLRRGTLGQPMSSPTVPAPLSRIAVANTAGKATVALPAGTDSCFAVRAVDAAGNASAWSPQGCVARAADDRALTATTAGWTRQSASGAYAGTLTTTTRAGASLVVRDVVGARLALVATTCPTCGSVDVFVGTTRLARVSLTAPTTVRRAVVTLPTFSHRRATVRVTTLNAGRNVALDGLLVAKS